MADFLSVPPDKVSGIWGVGVGTVDLLRRTQRRLRAGIIAAGGRSTAVGTQPGEHALPEDLVVHQHTPVGALGLSGRLSRMCRVLGVRTVAGLLALTRDRASTVRYVGEGTLAELEDLQSHLRRLVTTDSTQSHEATPQHAPASARWSLSTCTTLKETLTDYARRSVRDDLDADVWLLRRGLHPDCKGPLTRRQVARRLGTSAPRVQEAEKAAEGALRDPGCAKLIAPLTEHVVLAVAASLGVCRVGDFNQALRHRFGWAAAAESELYALLSVCGIDAWVSKGVVYHTDHCRSLLDRVRGLRAEVHRSVQPRRKLAESASRALAVLPPDCLDSSRDCYGTLFPCGARDERGRVLPESYLRGVFADLELPQVTGEMIWPREVWPAAETEVGFPQHPVPCSDIPVDALFPSGESHVATRARNLVARLGISTVAELAALDLNEVAGETRGMGARTMMYLQELLSDSAARGSPVHVATEPVAAEPEPPAVAAGSLRDALTEAASRSVQNPRNLEIWETRAGLTSSLDGKRPTLDDVAKRFSLTRERIRQIEVRTERRISSGEACVLLMPILEVVDAQLAKCLGICSLEHLASAMCTGLGWQAEPSAHELLALFRITDSGIAIRDGIVEHPDRCHALARTLRKVAPKIAERFPEGRHTADFAHDLGSSIASECLDPQRDCLRQSFTCGAREGEARVLPEPYVRALLGGVRPPILDGERVWPPQVWPLQRGTRKRDVVRAALHCLGRPIHYSELARFIRERNPRFGDITVRDVHACLTSYEEFVPVGRGMYATAGSAKAASKPRKHVTTAQAITALLREIGKPMPFRRIVEALGSKGYREANIFAALTNVRRFVEVGYRVYTLRSMLRREGEREEKGGIVIVDRLAGTRGGVIAVSEKSSR